MKPNAKTAGFPIDLVDKAINTWKHCIRCAESELKQSVTTYDFDEEHSYCGKMKNSKNGKWKKGSLVYTFLHQVFSKKSFSQFQKKSKNFGVKKLS